MKSLVASVPLIPVTSYGSFRSSMVNILRDAGMQTVWESLRLSFIPDFTAFMDDTGREAIARGYFDFPVVWSEFRRKVPSA